MADEATAWAEIGCQAAGLDWATVRAFLAEHPQALRNDAALLAELHLRPAAANVVEFGPAALARVSAAKAEAESARQALEATAAANFAAQAQTHAAVVDLLDSRNHSDLARRIDELATLRFGLAAGAIGVEAPGRAPAGWRALPEGFTDEALGSDGLARMGGVAHAAQLFGDRAETVASAAVVRLAIWAPARQAVLAFGSADPNGFTPDMGHDLVAFLGRVVERVAERWPVL